MSYKKSKWIEYACAHTVQKYKWRPFTKKELEENTKKSIKALINCFSLFGDTNYIYPKNKNHEC